MRADDRRLGILAGVLFFSTRVPLLLLRQPFFDELFTQWISAKPFGGILQALQSDSGPPLYYFVVHVLGHPRLLSLAFATIGFAALLRSRLYAAALLLAAFPPAVLFAVDARSYALCAMFVTLGIRALDRERPYHAAIAFVLAAYSHYYGVLFFPLLMGRLKPALTLLLFAPGLWLAIHQPRQAMDWMQHFAYPDALFVRPPVVLVILMAALLVGAFVGGAPPATARRVPPPKVVIPYVLSIPIYVPLRFESVVATPLVQWLASSRRVVYFGLLACFLMWTGIGIADHAKRPVDPYRDAALHVRDAHETVVASGYLFLETAVLRSDVVAFPPEQAQHPGWRAAATSGSGLPVGTFLWIGERNAPELAIIRQERAVQPVYANAGAIVARVR